MRLQYFATTNDNKLREMNHVLGYSLEKVHLDLTEPQDMDVEVIARFKAEEAFREFGQPVLVEDSAWYFEAWNGLPGPFAKFFLQAMGSAGILKMFGNESNRTVRAKTVLAFHDGSTVHVFPGETIGKLATEARGESGFGYDSIFIPDGYIQTFAEMTLDEKSKLSMRALAVQKLKAFLAENE